MVIQNWFFIEGFNLGMWTELLMNISLKDMRIWPNHLLAVQVVETPPKFNKPLTSIKMHPLATLRLRGWLISTVIWGWTLRPTLSHLWLAARWRRPIWASSQSLSSRKDLTRWAYQLLMSWNASFNNWTRRLRTR